MSFFYMKKPFICYYNFICLNFSKFFGKNIHVYFPQTSYFCHICYLFCI